MSLIWPLPKVSFKQLTEIEETRPVAVITSTETWEKMGSSLSLPLVVQAEPIETGQSYLRRLAGSLPKQARVVYAIGSGIPVTAAKLVAKENGLPLVIVPDALESDELFEAHIIVPAEGLLNRIETGPAQEVIIDWEVIQSAPPEKRAAAIVDVLAIVTALLDWRYAARQGKNRPEMKFSAWGAGVAASLASQAIKSAKDIGDGDPEAMRVLLDLLMMSVQLAGQLGHDRHQEGTEHYLAFSMENQGVNAHHSELVGAGILFASALHGQDPASLRDALVNAGVRLDSLRASDIRLAINDLPSFVSTNDLPFALSHDLDPFSEDVSNALEKAGILQPEPEQPEEEEASSEIELEEEPVEKTTLENEAEEEEVQEADSSSVETSTEASSPDVALSSESTTVIGSPPAEEDMQADKMPDDDTKILADTHSQPAAMMAPPPRPSNEFMTPNVDNEDEDADDPEQVE